MRTWGQRLQIQVPTLSWFPSHIQTGGRDLQTSSALSVIGESCNTAAQALCYFCDSRKEVFCLDFHFRHLATICLQNDLEICFSFLGVGGEMTISLIWHMNKEM